MLSITRNIVNDRISNRVDNVIDASTALAERLVNRLHSLRCLGYQQLCGFRRRDVFALERGSHPRGWGRGLKRFALEPAMSATPTFRHYWLATTIPAAGHRAVSDAE